MFKKKNSDFVNKLFDAFIGKGAFVIFSLLFSLIATRLYGVEVFGEFTFAFTLVSILMIFSKAGLDNGLIYSIPKTSYKFVSLSILVNFFFSSIVILVAYLFLDNSFIRFILPMIWLLSLEQIFFGIYRADGKIKEFFFINGFTAMLLRVALILVFYYIWGDSPFILALGVYISLIFSNIVYFVNYRNKIGKINFSKSFLLYSFPLVLANLLSVMMGKMDIIMLGMFSTKENVGIYQIVVQITSSISLLLIVYSTVFAPKISEYYHKNNIEGIKSLYIKGTRMLSTVGLLTTIFLVVFSEFILGLFGEGVIEGKFALLFLSLGQLINISVGNVWTIMAMTGKPKLQMYANLLAFATNILLNFLLIPKFGMEGAAIASLFTHLITNLLGYIAVSRRFKLKAFKWF